MYSTRKKAAVMAVSALLSLLAVIYTVAAFSGDEQTSAGTAQNPRTITGLLEELIHDS